jgi:hypothetical protein
VNQLPIVVVGVVDAAGIYASYSPGLVYELTVSALGTVQCAARAGDLTRRRGT